MELTQPEIIQILRRRAEMNQGEFGAKAFNTSHESGRTKVKNIELGKQIPTTEDLRKMSKVLEIPVADLLPTQDSIPQKQKTQKDGILVIQKVFDLFPNLSEYLTMLNKAVLIDDKDLIAYIAEKISALLLRVKISSKAVNS
ncbi:helix-turn-helix transcriptional regulator [Desulfococcaceae bacterium HSG8]|nr:helix-turn-helix transcriptional regulator [Desulfococcaceae bacterium HSG8]